MFSISEVKKIIGNEKISDKETEKIRDACYIIAELALEKLNSQTKDNYYKPQNPKTS